MAWIRLRTLAPALAAAACLSATAAASSASAATTFCVNSPPGCAGSVALTIGGALSSAVTSPGTDTIEIAGSNTYDESGLTDGDGNPVNIVGVGTPAPVITTAGAEPALLKVQDPSSTINNVAFELSAGSSGQGLEFDGATANGITVTGDAGDGAIGVDVIGDHATLSDSSITLPAVEGSTTTGVFLGGAGSRIIDSEVAASVGVAFNTQNATVSRVQVRAPIGVRSDDDAGNTVEDSLILNEGASGFTKYGVQANGTGTGMTVRGDTIVGVGQGDIGLGATGGGAIMASDSIIEGFTADLSNSDAGSTLSTDYDDYAATKPYSGGAAVLAGAHDLNVAPDFVNAATGDYHLAAGSPLIDKGDPAALAVGESRTDVYGADRLVAGHGGCTFVRDIGAAEFQVLVPTPVATAPPSAVAGTPVTFNGSKSCGPGASNPVTSWRWSFGDGTSATGAAVSHSFASPGKHVVTLTVSTIGKQSASTTVTVNVSARPLVTPVVKRLKISPGSFPLEVRRHHSAGATVSFTLNEPASVKFTVERRRSGHRRAVAVGRAFTKRGHAGANHFYFSGLHGHKLSKGSYELLATPSITRRTGRQSSVGFKIQA